MPINLENKEDCCGCTACSVACPKSCIAMEEDEEGFKYPHIDISLCINCDLCKKVCPIVQKDRLYCPSGATPKALGGWHKDEEIRKDSSSGGAFTLFAEYVLNSGGIVYGCTLDEELRAVHIGVESAEALTTLRGSKYVQSDLRDVYGQIKRELQKDRMVFFTGTPCQTAGLHSFLQKPYNNLYTCDFICHGVPSPKVFCSYLYYLETKYLDRITGFRFRMKDRGWHPSGLQLGTYIATANGKNIRRYPAFRDSFMNGFLNDIYLRPSCYNCRFKDLPKYYSDITIADFWGVNKVSSKLHDGKGTSLLLINSQHGEELFDRVKDQFHYEECDFRKSIRRNMSLITSASRSAQRERFFAEFAEKPFPYIRRKYMNAFCWFKHTAGRIIRKKLGL